MAKSIKLDRATDAVVRVGQGRGFIVQGRLERLIITAAHCVKETIVCHAAWGGTFVSVGPLGKKKPTIAATCYFIDPIADIAVLGPSDNQEYFEQWENYLELVDGGKALEISDAPSEGPAWLLSLDQRWTVAKARHINDGPLWITEAENIAGGMSGSPILGDGGSAIGVVCIGSQIGNSTQCHEGGPNARLSRNLPGWLLREFSLRKARTAKGK